jgi:hypothetical protein
MGLGLGLGPGFGTGLHSSSDQPLRSVLAVGRLAVGEGLLSALLRRILLVCPAGSSPSAAELGRRQRLREGRGASFPAAPIHAPAAGCRRLFRVDRLVTGVFISSRSWRMLSWAEPFAADRIREPIQAVCGWPRFCIQMSACSNRSPDRTRFRPTTQSVGHEGRLAPLDWAAEASSILQRASVRQSASGA